MMTTEPDGATSNTSQLISPRSSAATVQSQLRRSNFFTPRDPAWRGVPSIGWPNESRQDDDTKSDYLESE